MEEVDEGDKVQRGPMNGSVAAPESTARIAVDVRNLLAKCCRVWEIS